MLRLSATLTEAVFVYLCICVFVFVYLHVRHLGTLFLRSSYHYLFKNIAHVRSICNFDRSCICVFVYLCICICVFARQTPGNIAFEVPVPLPFQTSQELRMLSTVTLDCQVTKIVMNSDSQL